MDNNLYFVANMGCDDTTNGLIRLSDSDFPKFKAFIENLNKNSLYGCMPTISVYKIEIDQLREVNKDKDTDRGMWFYLDDKIYTYATECFGDLYKNCVIRGAM